MWEEERSASALIHQSNPIQFNSIQSFKQWLLALRLDPRLAIAVGAARCRSWYKKWFVSSEGSGEQQAASRTMGEGAGAVDGVPH